MFQSNAIEALSATLSQTTLRKSLEEASDAFLGNASQFPDGANKDIIRFLLRLHGQTSAFRDKVVSKLRQPPAITPEELNSLFCRQVFLKPSLEFDAAYEEFCKLAFAQADAAKVSEPKATIVYDSMTDLLLDNCVPYTLLDRGEQFRLVMSDVPQTDAHFEEWTVFLTLEGRFSDRALAEASVEFKEIVTTLLNSFKLIEELAQQGTALESVRTLIDSPNEDAVDALRTEYEQSEGDLDCCSKPRQLLQIVGGILDAHYSDVPKDSIARRIQNSVLLLVESDKQARHAVGLALSIASIEALICENGAELATMFAQNTVALLEPDPFHRASASKKCKELYSLRSKVLHGAQTQVLSDQLRDARLLAGAVLIAFAQRRQFRKRMGFEDERVQDLLEEIKKDIFTPGQLTGVDESPVVGLWR